MRDPVETRLHEQDFLVGRLLSERYLIESIIGRGSMGVVYKAIHTVIGRPVAIKTLNSHFLSEERSLRRFMREARATSRLSHPNIITVHDAGFTPNGVPYLVMDYIEGRTLAEALKSGERLQLAKSIDLAIGVCAALAHAHEERIIHRDLKPSNIMLMRNSIGQEVVKVVDFGIAKMARTEEDGTTVTRTGEVVGTPVYMSPEQATSMPLDERSDIYSFGIVLYELLAGKPPFRGKNPVETIRKHLVEAPPSFQAIGITNVPREIEKAVFRCLSKRPDDRYATMHELKLELEAARISISGLPSSQGAAAPRIPPIIIPEETTEEFLMFLKEKKQPVLEPMPEDSTVALRKLIQQHTELTKPTVRTKLPPQMPSNNPLKKPDTNGPSPHPKGLPVRVMVAAAIIVPTLATAAWLGTTMSPPKDVKPQANLQRLNDRTSVNGTANSPTDNYLDTVFNTKVTSVRRGKIKSSAENKSLAMKSPHAYTLIQKGSIRPHYSISLNKTFDIPPPSASQSRINRVMVAEPQKSSLTKTTPIGPPMSQGAVVEALHPKQQTSKKVSEMSSNEEQTPNVALQPAILLPSRIPDKVAAAHQDVIVQLNNEGLEAMRARIFPEAIEKFEAALRLDPSYSKARHNLLSTYNNYALMLHQSGQLDKAERYYRKALALHSGYQAAMPVFKNYAALLRATNRSSEAEKVEAQAGR